MLVFITAVLIVLVVSFLCSIFESVLLSLTRPQIEVVSRKRRTAGALLTAFKDNIDVPIAAILILNTAAHTVGASVAGASYADVFNDSTLWLFTIVFTGAVLLFTEIIPKTLGVSYATALAVPVAHGIRWLTLALKPIVVLSERISRSLRRNDDVPVTTPEEIRVLAALGRRAGAVGPRTAGMIAGATHLAQMQAHDVMLPREDVQFLSAEMDRDEALALVRQTGHSRFPFSPTRDIADVTGMVLAKSLLNWLLTNDSTRIDWDAVSRDVLVVPEFVPVSRLLQIYQDTQRHLAVVVDEFGSVRGIATLEDVLEELVGDIRDESDMPVEEFLTRPDGSLVVPGRTDLRKLSARLGVSWEPEADVATIGGLVTERLESIPRVGDSIAWKGHIVEVTRADRRSVRQVAVRKDGR